MGRCTRYPRQSTRIRCKACGGSGEQKVTVHGGKDFTMSCHWCGGTGYMDGHRLAQYINYRSMWCECGNKSGQVQFYDDGEHPAVDKHHWRCTDCGKVVQIG